MYFVWKKMIKVIDFILVWAPCVSLIIVVPRTGGFFPSCLKRKRQIWRKCYVTVYKAVYLSLTVE